MKKNLVTVLQAFITTTIIAVSFTFAQGSAGNSAMDFFSEISVKIYCTFSKCDSNVTVAQKGQANDATSTKQFVENKLNQISQVITRTVNNPSNVVYVQGPRGRDGTTTIVYETRLAGAPMFSPSGYINAGGNGFVNNPYQTSVPADIWQTFVHQLQFENAVGGNLSAVNVFATTTDTDNLFFDVALGGNLTATDTVYANNLVGTSSTITNSTSTTFYSLWGNILELLANNATITNSTSTNVYSDYATLVNLLGTSATITDATTTTLFATKASITEATTTYFFAAWANFLNLFVANLSFQDATGTNLQVQNAYTTNLSATGTSYMTFADVGMLTASSTYASTSYADALTAVNATTTNLFSDNASVTNSTSTNLFVNFANFGEATSTYLFSNFFNTWYGYINQFTFETATGTNLQVRDFSTTNINATGTATITNLLATNATITNLSVANCSKGNVLCDGGNDTGAVIGPDPVLTIGTLNAGNIEFITGDTGFPSITPGSAKLIIETGVAGDGNGDVRVAQSLKVGENLVASGTITSTNLVATGTFSLVNGTMTNATATKIFATNASITNATSTNLFSASAKFLNLIVDKLTANVVNVGVLNATTSVNALVMNASTTNASTTNTIALLATNSTVTNATSTNLFASVLRAVNATIDTLSTPLINTGTVNATSSVNTLVLNASTTNASTTNFINANGTNATITSATTTNLFAKFFNFINATGTDLRATGTSNLASIISASSTLAGTNITSGNAIFTRATTTNSTTTTLYVGGLAVFSDDVTINNQLNVDAGTLFVNDVDERVGINTATPITAGNVRLTVAGDIRVGTATTNGCVQRFDGTALTGTCSSDERLKENVSELDSSDLLNKIRNINFVSYSWNDTAEEVYGNVKGSKILGVTAQNVEAQFPELVSTDEFGYKRVNITDLQWYMFASIKAVNNKIDSMNSKITNTFESVYATLVVADKVTTKELCVGDSCFTADEMKEFRAYLDSKKAQAPAPMPVAPQAPVVAPTDSGTTTEPTDTGSSTPEAPVETPVQPVDSGTQAPTDSNPTDSGTTTQ
jgi:hypothetical protein